MYIIIIYQTHYEKSDWSRAFNQFTIACELDMINAIGHFRNVRGLGKSMVVFRLFEKLKYSNERSTIF